MFFAFILLCLIHSIKSTPLDDYVWREDPAYGWTDTGATISGKSSDGSKSWIGYVLNMTSQRWLTPEETSISLWYHQMVVIVPSNLHWYRNASLYITGGHNGDGVPDAKGEDIILSAALAMATGSITTALFQIPNQCMVFASDPLQKCRSEDSIIAFTWDHYLKDPSKPEWLVRFPMVKASLRAMDTTTSFVASKFPDQGFNIDSYVVAGASKRGWTTWLVGAVDPVRVKGIVPIVLDAINFVAVEHHEWRSYGGWSFALQDYWELNITARFDDPNMQKLCEMEDPYYYASRLTLPKLVINAGADEFQHPDDTHYWWNDMPEPKHFIMVPNAEHSMATGILEIVPVIGTWILYLLNEKPVPKLTWEISPKSGEITATLGGGMVPSFVYMWSTETCNHQRRDFRIVNLDKPCLCGISVAPKIHNATGGYCLNTKILWKKTPLNATDPDGKIYKASVPLDKDGKWAAFFIDITYEKTEFTALSHSGSSLSHLNDRKVLTDVSTWPVTEPGRLEFTTEVSIWPNTFPFKDCHGAECLGTLL